LVVADAYIGDDSCRPPVPPRLQRACDALGFRLPGGDFGGGGQRSSPTGGGGDREVKCPPFETRVGISRNGDEHGFAFDCEPVARLKQMVLDARIDAATEDGSGGGTEGGDSDGDAVTQLVDGKSGARYDVGAKDVAYIDTHLQLPADEAQRQYERLRRDAFLHMIIGDAPYTTKSDRARLFALLAAVHAWRVGNPQYAATLRDQSEWSDVFAHYIRNKPSAVGGTAASGSGQLSNRRRFGGDAWREWTRWASSALHTPRPARDFYVGGGGGGGGGGGDQP
jgi:hypothetical protein